MSRPPSQGSQRQHYGEASQERGSDGFSGYKDSKWSANGSPSGQHQGYQHGQGGGPYDDHAYRMRGPEGVYPPGQHDRRHFHQHSQPPQHYQNQQHHHQQTPSHHHPQGPQRPPPPIRLVPGQPPPFPFQSMQQQHHPTNTHFQGPRAHSNHHYHNQHQHHQHHQQRQQETFSEHQFPVHPLDRFKVKCAPFRQPIEIGSFSYDEKRNFVMDDSQLVRTAQMDTFSRVLLPRMEEIWEN
ncbi:MAG: hypothetical protein JOS17DRAFT_744634, partial [Linnemannia elongata]